MKAEIIAVGTELLLGQIVNTNAQFLSRACADLGVSVYFQTVVGDNESRLTEALRVAAGRADLVICTGGLGPTQDDLTKDALAAYIGSKLVIHQPSMDKIEQFFSVRGIHMVESNKRQALILEYSDPLANDTGMAVGVGLTHEGTHYVLLPGPPKEMKPMFERYAAPWIAARMDGVFPLYSRMLKFAGIGESLLEHELLDLIQAQSDPTIAPYAKEGEVAIRLTTRAASQAEADGRLVPVEDEIRRRLGSYIFANEDVSIERQIIGIMRDKGQKLAVAESCTGGLLSDMLTAVPGSSAVFQGGIVCYTIGWKEKLLNVPRSILEGPGAPGAISDEAARLLADNLLRQSDADFSIAITGVAGPDESEGKPVGLVYVAVAQRDQETAVQQLRLSGSREMIKLRAARSALYQLWKRL